jgi:hypothetical protein
MIDTTINFISISSGYIDGNNLDKFSTIIFEMLDDDDDFYFYLFEESDKIDDISKMPSYIQTDWIEHNKILLNDRILRQEIKKLEFATKIIDKDSAEKALSDLKLIKRELRLRKLI